ncbi:protein FAR1-RELATED SEQUENCE 5-like isoform X2 [Carya illinoinensis]|uniref:protein FAR1-RELATED SEQUENCE 5-like isoform X2 n=1 Tax=Carya illinoinensis TaxID=32201 RepID=UPI001C718AC2|nr:protein FAR1-RELATED SEQUENCE 5-like isoform X2 [Carya illinoinensis]
MEKEKEQPTTQTSNSSNPPSKAIPSTSQNIPNYMSGYFGPVPTWSPTFLPYPAANQYPINIQNGGYSFQHNMEPPSHLSNTSSATSKIVGSGLDNTTDGGESEAPCGSPIVDDSNNGSGEKSQNVQMVNDDTIDEPKSGMEFNSVEELLSYYKEYGKKCGFGVMIKRTEREEDDSVRYVTLSCARGGKARNRTLNVANPRPTGKTECKAKINALRQDGVLRLTTVHNIHNHGLSPKKSRFFRCNREVSDAVKRVLDTNDLAGIRASKSYGSLVVGAGGFENLPFLEKDCRNYIDKARHLRLGAGGAGALQQYFLRMQYKNPGFFYMMDIDDDGRLKNVFWADPRSRAAYQYFGDVVTFDTTYLTNRYGMPFAPFVGVNHHGQSILLGAGLISSEDTETFVWLFKTWLQCMDGNAPKAIITDQDRAMKNAIAIVFPNSRHRFCLWHILKKVPEKLGSYGTYKTGMKSALMKCVYDSQCVDEFEKCWDQLLTTYNLGDNAWLQSLYLEREHWVPAFLKNCFWAGMSTTQRSESMNAFFDGYVHSRTNLKEFVDQFDNALKKKIENENLADFQSFNVTIPCISRSPIEKRFQELYTIAKFKEVQHQVNGIIDLNPKLHNSVGAIKTYMVEDEVCLEEFTKLVNHSVDFSEEDAVAKCSCGLFEMRGILCRHILAVFRCNDIKFLPDIYILDRWRKDIRRRYTLIHSSYDAGEQHADSSRYTSLLHICYQMITYASSTRENTEDARNKLNAMIELYRANQEGPSMTQIGSNVESKANDTIVGASGEVRSPRVVRGKGRPPSLRRASRMEIDMRKAKAKAKKAPAKGKRKERDGGDTHVVDKGDTPVTEVYRNLFGPSEMVVSNVGHMQAIPERGDVAIDITGAQSREIAIQSQESMEIGLENSQFVHFRLDGSQPLE